MSGQRSRRLKALRGARLDKGVPDGTHNAPPAASDGLEDGDAAGAVAELNELAAAAERSDETLLAPAPRDPVAPASPDAASPRGADVAPAEPPALPNAAGMAAASAESADEFGDGLGFYRFSAFLGLAAALLLAAAVVTYSLAGAFNKNVVALVIVAGVFGVLYLIPRLDEIGAWVGTRTARQGGNATLLSVAFIGLLVVGNWYANRHSPQWDLTAAKRYTLSDQTHKILNGLDRDVKITYFFAGRQGDDTFTRGTKDLLRQYTRKSKHVALEMIDADLNPGAARQFDIKSVPVTIFQAGDRKEETTGLTEQDFTSALLKLTRTDKKKVYFLQGHQERDPDSSQPTGFSNAGDALKRENYVVEKLSLLATQKVPDDAAVLVIAGPRAPLLEPERAAINDYVDRGGHVLLLAEPRQEVGLGDLLDRWHIKLGNDVVVDPERYFGDPVSPAPLPQQGHRISTGLPDIIMPGARSVSIVPGAGGDFAIAPLLKTTDRAWGETNLNPGVPARPDPGEDLRGPVTMAVAVNKTDPVPAVNPGAPPTPTPAASPAEKKPKGRLVVVGNADFASNTWIGQVLGNRDLFVNSVDWLAEDEDLISIRAEPAGAAPIFLTNQSQVVVIFTSVIFIPLAVLLAGALVWWQRR